MNLKYNADHKMWYYEAEDGKWKYIPTVVVQYIKELEQKLEK